VKGSVGAVNLNDPEIPTRRWRKGLVNLWNSDNKNLVSHVGFELFEVSVVGDLEPGHEVPTLHAHLEHPLVLELHQHVFVGEAGKRHLPHVSSGRLPPVHTGVHRRPGSEFETGEETGDGRRERKIEERIPHSEEIGGVALLLVHWND